MKVNKKKKKKAVTAGFFIATFIGSIMLFTTIFKGLGKLDDSLEDDHEHI
jgi:hypothetical protein